MLRFKCPRCEAPMEVDESFAGRRARCPTCGADLKIPEADESGATALPMDGTPSPGATVVRIGGEMIHVRAPLEPMAVFSVGLTGLAVVAVLGVGLVAQVAAPWTVGAAVGALFALLGAVTGLPAWHSIRRSRGRRRGRGLALTGVLGGAVLFVGLGVVAAVGAVQIALRPECEDNLRTIYAALRAYADAHDGRLPDGLDDLVREDFLDDRTRLTCPARRVPAGAVTYVIIRKVNLRDPRFPKDLMIVHDGPPYGAHGDGLVRVLRLDGKVLRVPLADWPAYQAAQVRRWEAIQQQIVDEAAAGDSGDGPAKESP